MIKEQIISKALEIAIKQAGKLLKQFGYLFKHDQVESSLNLHLKKVKNWSAEISFKDANQPKLISQVFIHLDLYLQPRREQLDDFEVKKITIDKLPQNKHLVLLGEPGAGKTTTVKYFCHKILFSEDELFRDYNYPVLLKFRDLTHFSSQTFLYDELLDVFGVDIIAKTEKKYSKKSYHEIIKKFTLSFLDSQKVVLILDGFDELPDANARENAIKNIRELTITLENSIVILTSRSSDFSYHIDNTAEYEFSSLSKYQIQKFTTRWLDDENKGSDLFQKIMDSPFSDTVIRPLTVAHLCAIYDRMGDIPKKPKTVYKKTINLLLEEWDQQRSVERISNYSKFEVDRKFEFLSSLAYHLTTDFNTITFDSKNLEKIYKKIYANFELPYDDCLRVVNEVETHSGLFIKTGYDKFEFAHKSLQEYLTAEYIVKLPNIPSDISLLKKIPNELAIAVTISSNNDIYFIELAENRISSHMSFDFIKIFIMRLILEKPEFSQRLEIIMWLIRFYGVLISDGTYSITGRKNRKERTNQATLFLDQRIEELEKYIISLISKNLNFIDHVKRYYDRDNTSGEDESLDRAGAYKFNKMNIVTGPESIFLPKKIVHVYN